MLKQARLTAVLKSIDNYKEQESQAVYAVNMGLQKREYSRVELNGQRLVEIDNMLESLNQEAKEIQQAIDDENRDVL